ncbi:MAG: hypothetical protein WKF37_19875 [Bryobacteraceae bacterium]
MLNVICPERIDPVAEPTWRCCRRLTIQPESFNYRSFNSSESKQNVPSIKGDYVFSDKNHVSVLYSRFYTPAQPNIGNFEGSHPQAGTLPRRFSITVLITITFSPNLLNHLTLGFNKRHLIENPAM